MKIADHQHLHHYYGRLSPSWHRLGRGETGEINDSSDIMLVALNVLKFLIPFKYVIGIPTMERSRGTTWSCGNVDLSLGAWKYLAHWAMLKLIYCLCISSKNKPWCRPLKSFLNDFWSDKTRLPISTEAFVWLWKLIRLDIWSDKVLFCLLHIPLGNK